MCGILEHAKEAHTIVEAGAHETEQKKHVEKLVSKADAKIRNVDKYFTFIEDQRKRLHTILERLNGEIDATFEETVEKLKERKTVLKKEVRHKLGKLKTSLVDVEESVRKQIDEIMKVLDLVKDVLNFPLQTEALTAHKAMCQQLEELLNHVGPDEELPRRAAEEGKRIGFRSQGSDGLRLGQLTHSREVPAHTKSKWVLRTQVPLPNGKSMRGMVISPNNEMAVGYNEGGIVLYSPDGIQKTVLKDVNVIVPYTSCLTVDTSYATLITKCPCTQSFVTSLMSRLKHSLVMRKVWMEVSLLGKDGLIFIGYSFGNKIQVFKPEGGKAIGEIRCDGYDQWQMFAMTSSQAIVVKSARTRTWTRQYQVQVINDVSGAIIHIISSDGYTPYPAVCQDDSVIIAWVKHGQGLVSIVQYTKELKYIKNILTDFKINVSYVNIAVCKHSRRERLFSAIMTGFTSSMRHGSKF